jgi:hypothetical protein
VVAVTLRTYLLVGNLLGRLEITFDIVIPRVVRSSDDRFNITFDIVIPRVVRSSDDGFNITFDIVIPRVVRSSDDRFDITFDIIIPRVVRSSDDRFDSLNGKSATGFIVRNQWRSHCCTDIYFFS